jgi:hypothetical protein
MAEQQMQGGTIRRMIADGHWRPIAAWTAVAGLLVVAALFRYIEHDDGQYVGAVALMRDGLPYRDFAYLQTPLQPLLFGPFASLAEGWLYPALRVANALMGAVAAGLLYRIVEEAGGGRRMAALAAACLVCSHIFLFGATQARNDMLPLVLHVAGLLCLLRVWRGDGGVIAALFAGVLLGAAASAKVSYGLPAAAAGVAALLCWRQLGWQRVAGFAAGGVSGLIPCIWMWSVAPDAFMAEVVRYSIDAPPEWQNWLGQPGMLGLPLRLARSLLFLVQGAGLLALVMVAVDRAKRPRAGGVTALLDALILAGAIAAVLPVPLYAQYWIPVLPALFARFALLLAERGGLGWPGKLALVLLPAGLAVTAIDVGGNLFALRSPPIEAMRDGRWAGGLLNGFDVEGEIAGLAPEAMVSSGRPLDRRFVAGPFLFRTRDVLTAAEADAFHVVTQRNYAGSLIADPPAGLLLGSEAKPTPDLPHGLDGELADWARAQGYKPYPAPSGHRTLWVRP